MGIILRLTIVKTLGLFFTVDVTIKQNHRLKKDGFYRYLRHPSYSASLLSFIGFGISLNNLISLILAFILTLTAFIIRIKIEERILTDHFGSEYLDYKILLRELYHSFINKSERTTKAIRSAGCSSENLTIL